MNVGICAPSFLAVSLLLASWSLELPWDRVLRKYNLHSKAAVVTCSEGSLDPPRRFEDCSRTKCSEQQVRVTPHSACLSFPIQLASQLGDQEFVCWSLFFHINELCTEIVFRSCISIRDSQSAVSADCWKEQKGWMDSIPILKHLRNNIFFLEQHTWKDGEVFRFSWKAGG